MKIPQLQLPPFAVYFKSILSVHSETAGNISTHLIIGCLAFFFIFLWFFTRPDMHIQFQMIAVIMALAAIVVSFWDKINAKLYRPLRAYIFSCMGLNVTETSTTTTTMDLPHGHRKLPAELDREIFLFFKPATQRKFIWGLGWDFYAMFRYRLLTKTKRVRNPHRNLWNKNNTNSTATIAADGLHVSNQIGFSNIFAEQPFPTSGPHCRADDFPGTILYYYEVQANVCILGLSSVAILDWISQDSNSYSIPIVGHPCHGCWLAGERHLFEFPAGATRPTWNIAIGSVNVYGCGLVLDTQDKLAIFFTLNGQLLSRKNPISPTVDRLFPAITMMWDEFCFVTNFGDDPAKPFEYDIKNCPGLELACI